MWNKAARDLSAYREAVLNAVDVDGFPVSVRQTTPRYDVETGTLPLRLPSTLRLAEGPASLLAHHHDDKLWSLKAMLIRGRIEQRGDSWQFVSLEYKTRPPWTMLKDARRAVEQYLSKRGLPRPRIAYDVIHRLQREAKSIKDS
jgi:hypothetical protein